MKQPIRVRSAFFFWFLFLSSLAESSHSAPIPDFLWGVGNAAFQVEGHPADSDWYRFTHTPRRIRDRTNADLATDFWNRYSEDFSLARELGSNSFRISIAWERIEPKRGVWDEAALDHYAEMIQEMRRQGLEPVVTLHHYVLPAWLVHEGGLLAPDFPSLFTEYGLKVMTRLSKAPTDVKLWMTFNEPVVLVFGGYIMGIWPPQQAFATGKATRAMAALARAHLMLVREVRLRDFPSVKLSIAKHWSVFQPHSRSQADLAEALKADDIFNRQFMTAVMTGKLRFSMPGAKTVREDIALPDGRPGLDYLGLNYYRRSLITHLPIFPYFLPRTGPLAKNDLGWEMYPEGFYLTLKDVARYNLPILVSENGVADAEDRFRPEFLREHLAALARARREGVPVMGYLHWTLTDNFEWAEGFSAKFGLVKIVPGTLARERRASFHIYQDIIREASHNPGDPARIQ